MKKIVELEKELITYDGADRVIPFSEMREEFNKLPKGFMVHCDFYNLDKLVDGFSEGELVLVSGRPKSGKTLLLQTFTVQFAKKKEKVLWFSYEVPPRQFLESFPEIPEGYMPKQMELADINWLDKRIWESKLKYRTRIIIIDHIHYLVDMSRLRNASLEIGNIYRRLKLMAIKYKIVIFIVSHLKKVEHGVEPQAEDVRDTNFALGEPDTVLIMWRILDDVKKGYKDESRLKVEMTRRTGVLGKKVSLRKKYGLLEEIL